MNTASTQSFDLILKEDPRKPLLNPRAVERVANSILSLEIWLEQLRQLVIASGPSQAVIELIREDERRAIELRNSILNSVDSSEFLLEDASYKIIANLKKFAKSVALAFTKMRRMLARALKNEKEIAG